MIKQKSLFALVFFHLLFLALGCLNSNTPTRGTISGRVTDGDGNPLSGVAVIAADKSAVTDVNGNFQIGDLNAEVITVTAQRTGYESRSAVIEVYSGQLRSGIDFSLTVQGEVYNVAVSNVTSTGAIISFSTKNLSSAYVQYGLSPLFGAVIQSTASGSLHHRIEIASLTPASTYHFMAVANDTQGRTLRSTSRTFSTTFTRRGDPPGGLQVTVNPGSQNVLLTWNEDTGIDFVGFKVYRAESTTAAPQALNTTPVTVGRFVDTTLTPGEKGFYTVTRVAGTGEESPPCGIVEFLLPGQTRKNLVWTPEQGTYSLTGDLFIRAEDSLTIHPGVSVKVAGQDAGNLSNSDPQRIEIRVDGAIYIEATASNPVSITSDHPSPTPGDWVGLTFSSTSNLAVSLLKGVNVAFADQGVNGAMGLPPVQDSRFSNCKTAGVALQDARTEAYIERSSFLQCGTGVIVASCTGTRVTVASNTFESCPIGIEAKGNREIQIEFNRIRFWTTAGMDLNNQSLSTARQNLLAPSGVGTAIVCRGLDEIRRNTMQGQTGIEIAGSAQTRLLSNLLLSSKARAGIGFYYNGTAAYNNASHTIVANVIWDQDDEALRHRTAAGTAVTPAITSYLMDPILEGGDPFGVASLTFNYQPRKDSPLKRLGYGGEDVGAYDVP